MPAKKKAARKTSKKAAAKVGPIRLPPIPEDRLTPEQRALMSAIASGPRGQFKMGGPFFCYLHSPGLRRARAEARRPSALRHLDPAAAVANSRS